MVYPVDKLLVRICQNSVGTEQVTIAGIESSHAVGSALGEGEGPVVHDGGAVIGCIEGVATRTQVKLGDSSCRCYVFNIDLYEGIPKGTENLNLCLCKKNEYLSGLFCV